MRASLTCAPVPQGRGRAPVQWHLMGFFSELLHHCAFWRVATTSSASPVIRYTFHPQIALRSLAQDKCYPSRARAVLLAWNLLKEKPEASRTQSHLPASQCSVLKQSSGVKRTFIFTATWQMTWAGWARAWGDVSFLLHLPVVETRGAPDCNPGPLRDPGGAHDQASLELHC